MEYLYHLHWIAGSSLNVLQIGVNRMVFININLAFSDLEHPSNVALFSRLCKHMGELKEYSVIIRTSFYDINWKILPRKSLFTKFQLIPIFHLQVMHFYVHGHFPIDNSVKLILGHENLC